MIKVSNFRNNGGGEILQSEPEVPVAEAVRLLVSGELTFGGRVTKCSPTSIEVETRVLSCRDRTVFTGSAEEMEVLIAVTVAYMDADNDVNMDDLVDRVSKMSEGNPLLVAHGGPLIRGKMALEILMKKAGG